MTLDLERIAREYDEVAPVYERLGKTLEGAIHNALLDEGIVHTMGRRTKDFASLVRKAVRRGFTDPIKQTTDFAGVRVILPFIGLKADVTQLVKARFHVIEDDDKVVHYGSRELGYLGRHLQASFRDMDVTDTTLRGKSAEIQLQTRAESAWADASHDLTYKAALDLPPKLDRRVNRLLALVELFDLEMAAAHEDVLALPGFPAARMLQVLDRALLPLARRDYDRELSITILSTLAAAYAPDDVARFDVVVRDFLAHDRERVAALYERWGPDPYAHPLLFQPEALVVFERLDAADIPLRRAWDAALPPSLLDSLAELWGSVIVRPGDRE